MPAGGEIPTIKIKRGDKRNNKPPPRGVGAKYFEIAASHKSGVRFSNCLFWYKLAAIAAVV